MTSPHGRAQEMEKAARKVIYDLGHRDIDWNCCISDEKAVEIITTALQAAQADVFREVASKADLNHFSNMSFLAEWCEAQAKQLEGI